MADLWRFTRGIVAGVLRLPGGILLASNALFAAAYLACGPHAIALNGPEIHVSRDGEPALHIRLTNAARGEVLAWAMMH